MTMALENVTRLLVVFMVPATPHKTTGRVIALSVLIALTTPRAMATRVPSTLLLPSTPRTMLLPRFTYILISRLMP